MCAAWLGELTASVQARLWPCYSKDFRLQEVLHGQVHRLAQGRLTWYSRKVRVVLTCGRDSHLI